MNTIKRLQSILDEKHLTMLEIAEGTGISYDTLKSAKRNGSQLSVDNITLICAYLQMPLCRFFSNDSVVCGDGRLCNQIEGKSKTELNQCE